MTCDVCGLPDLHHGQGDGVGSCECPRCDCGNAVWSALCTCPPYDGGEWDDEPLSETYPGSGIYE